MGLFLFTVLGITGSFQSGNFLKGLVVGIVLSLIYISNL